MSIDWTKLQTAEDKQAKAAAEETARANAAARKELAETDWHFLRELETGKPMPAEIRTKRRAARAKVV